MLLYRCQWAPNTVFEDVQEIQPWCRITTTASQPHNELSTNMQFFRGGSILPLDWGSLFGKSGQIKQNSSNSGTSDATDQKNIN